MKILFCDLDGTLIDYDEKANPKNTEALRKWQDEGNKIAICSGRCEQDCWGHCILIRFLMIILYLVRVVKLL